MSSPQSSGSQAESLSVARSSSREERSAGDKEEEEEATGGRAGCGAAAAPAAAAERHKNKRRQNLASEEEEGIQNLLEKMPQIRDNFNVLSKIGEGTFSSVYLATLKGCSDAEEKFAVKHLVPTCSPSRVENELRFLQMLGGRDHVITIHTCLRHRDHIALIMPFFPHGRFADYLPLLSVAEAQGYMRALFRALCNVHSHRIIHRDIKPSNFLYNRASQQFQLVDFGLAHLEKDYNTGHGSSVHGNAKARLSDPRPSEPHKLRRVSGGGVNGLVVQAPAAGGYQRSLHHRAAAVGKAVRRQTAPRGRGTNSNGATKSTEEIRLCPLRHKFTEVCDFCMSRSQQAAPRAGTPGFRAPEVLLKCPNQTTAVDMWSTGVILLCLLSGRYPFFKAHNDLAALTQIISLLGSRECSQAARSYGKELVVVPEVPRVDLTELCSKLRESLPPPPPPSNPVSSSEAEPSPLKRARLGNSSPAKPAHSCCSSNHHCLRNSPRVRKSPRKNTTSSAAVNSSLCCCSQAKDGLSWKNVPPSVYDLLSKCLDLNPATRISAEQALRHDFITEQLH